MENNKTNSNASSIPGITSGPNKYQEYPDGSSKAMNFNSPPQSNFNSEEMRGSMQQILSENIGEYVVIEFLIGTSTMMRKQGFLYYVGRSYVTLYDEQNSNFIVCDIFSVKFVYFYLPGTKPKRNYNTLAPSANPSANHTNR